MQFYAGKRSGPTLMDASDQNAKSRTASLSLTGKQKRSFWLIRAQISVFFLDHLFADKERNLTTNSTFMEPKHWTEHFIHTTPGPPVSEKPR